MLPFRGFQAFVAAVVTLATLPGCTGDGSARHDGGGPPQSATIGASGEPSLDALLAAPAEAIAALKVDYPDLVTVDTFMFDSTPTAVYQRHRYVRGRLIQARTGNQHDVALRLDVFADQDEARGFLATYHRRRYIHQSVSVPGWPDVANFQALDQVQDILYSFVRGRSVVHLTLDHGRFDSKETAAAELGRALDLVNASLDETVPIRHGANGTPTATPEGEMTPTEAPRTPPALEDYIAAAVVAVEALAFEYPELYAHQTSPYDPVLSEVEDLREMHGWRDGTSVSATTLAGPTAIRLRLDVFDDVDGARGFRAGHDERIFVDDPVKVPGWPGTANVAISGEVQNISYSLTHGPAMIRLRLGYHGLGEGPEAVAAELSTALDIVQASLNETVPVPE